MQTRYWAFVAVGSLILIALAVARIGSAGIADGARRRAIGRRTVHVYTKVAVLLLNAIVCFACLELVSGGASILGGPATAEEEPLDPRSASSYYVSQPWAPQYWREFRDSRRQRYQPYVLWNRPAFLGQTINIDDNGVRLTPGAVCDSNAFKIFVLGGSTVWGTGAADWGTLPAYLQIELQRLNDRPVCVVNLGESGYVSTQSVLRLLLQLRAGHVPHLVISYEGGNDVYSAYQSGQSGVHENLDQLVAAFEGSQTVEHWAIGSLMRRTAVFALTADLLGRVTHAVKAPPPVLTYRTMGVDEDGLAASVAQTYLGNYDVVDGLARKYGFDFRFVWSPYISNGRKPLLAEEQAIVRKIDPSLDSLYHSVYRRIAALAPGYSRFSDATGIFDDCLGLVWLDDMHVTPVGNQLLAARLVKELTPHFKARTAADSGR